MFDLLRRLFKRDKPNQDRLREVVAQSASRKRGETPSDRSDRPGESTRTTNTSSEPSASAHPIGSAIAPKPALSPQSRPIGEVATIYIGLDWGTHSTKIVIRSDYAERGDLLIVQPRPDSTRFDPHADAPYPWFAIPSVVGVDGGRLVFGEAARRLPAERKHYALKATLLKGAPLMAASLAQDILGRSPEHAVDVLATAFIAWVLQHVRARLDDLFGPGHWQPFVSMAAPMNHFENAQLKARYQRILHSAHAGVFGPIDSRLDTSWHLHTVTQAIKQLLESPLPSDDEQRFAVLPETVAGMVPVSKDPRRSAGAYNVIDIGGGSTEVSIVYLSIEARSVIDCVADESVATGAMDLLSFAAKERGTDPLHQIRKALRTRWKESYMLDVKSSVRRNQWKFNTVLKAGGGWVDSRIEQTLNADHPSREYFGPPKGKGFRLDFVLYQPSQEVLGIARSPLTPAGANREQFHFLPVALGLCFYPDWPDWYRPSQAVPAQPDPEKLLHVDPFHGHS